MTKADEVGTHLLDLKHLLQNLLVGHGSAHACVVFMAMGSLKEQAMAVEEERTMLTKLKRTESELLHDGLLAIGDSGGVEMWCVNVPKNGFLYHNGLGVVTPIDGLAVRRNDFHLKMGRSTRTIRTVQRMH